MELWESPHHGKIHKLSSCRQRLDGVENELRTPPPGEPWGLPHGVQSADRQGGMESP